MNYLKTTPTAAKLTARQQQILDLIRDVMQETGAPPTRAEIANTLGFKSANAAEEHLQALARKGAIELVSGTSRGIRLKQTPASMERHSRDLQDRHLAANADIYSLPLVGSVAAGVPILAQEHVERSYQVEAHLFKSRPDYLLKVKGMSMRDAGIVDGDLLAVRITKNALNGQIVVARLDDAVTVKRFVKTANHIELRAENESFAPIILTKSESIEIEGVAVGLIRNQL
ncbi:MAG: hypothetical protein RLZZ591_579 [Pseudomonadota bacterium]|jgi:repressor LexA